MGLVWDLNGARHDGVLANPLANDTPTRATGPLGARSQRATPASRTLTFAPLDRRLIDLGLMTPEEQAWVDDYHAQVAALVRPQLDGEAAEWLQAETAPL